MDQTARILVTGGHGFVGKNLVGALYRLGFHNVIAPARLMCDLEDRERTDGFVRWARPSHVFHLAGFVRGIKGNIENQAEAYRINALCNTHLVEACINAKVEKLVCMGTVAMYPDIPSLLREDMLWQGFPYSAEYGYAQAKRGMLAHLEVSGLKWAMPIATNMYGPYDRFDTEHGHVVPSLVRKFHEGDPVVWGDGSAQRDFLHVSDAVRGLLLIMEAGEGVINLASGESRSIREVVDILVAKTGRTVSWDASQPVGQRFRNYDVSKLAELGFEPKVALEEGLPQTMEWYANHATAATVVRLAASLDRKTLAATSAP